MWWRSTKCKTPMQRTTSEPFWNAFHKALSPSGNSTFWRSLATASMAGEAFQDSSWKTICSCKGICGAGMDSRYRSGRSTRKKPCAGFLPVYASAGGQTATICWQARPAHQVRGLSGGVTKQAERPARKNRQLPLRVQLPLHRKQTMCPMDAERCACSFRASGAHTRGGDPTTDLSQSSCGEYRKQRRPLFLLDPPVE